ncbi:protein AHNAK2 [Amblyraja radiata]|uniref:protein AHNAK2 n=1 Tax=Amblyraja radiata TaxID=386614 RepID=UPI0014035B54|nr:protein AHNAK2 [Amblyraja radiata]
MCDCFHLPFANWRGDPASGSVQCLKDAETEPGEQDSVCELPTEFVETVRPRPQGSSPVYDYTLAEEYKDKNVPAETLIDIADNKQRLENLSKKGFSANMSNKAKEKEDIVEMLVTTDIEKGASGFSVKGGKKDGIFIKHVQKESPAAKRLSMREGDQLISATIYFDNVKYEDALKILQYSEPYKMQYCLKRTIPGTVESVEVEGKGTKPNAGAEEDFFMKLYASKSNTRGISDECNAEETPLIQETTQKVKTKKAEVSDASFICPKFSSFKKSKSHKLNRSQSLTEPEQRDQYDTTSTCTDIENPQKRKKNKRKIKLPHIGTSAINMGKKETSEDVKQDILIGIKDCAAVEQDTLQINTDSTPQRSKEIMMITTNQSTQMLDKQSEQMECDNISSESNVKMPKLKIAKFVLPGPILITQHIATKILEERAHSESMPEDISKKEPNITDVKTDFMLPLPKKHDEDMNKQAADISIQSFETENKKKNNERQQKIKQSKITKPKDKISGTESKSSTIAIDVSLMKFDVSQTSKDLAVTTTEVITGPSTMESEQMSGLEEQTIIRNVKTGTKKLDGAISLDGATNQDNIRDGELTAKGQECVTSSKQFGATPIKQTKKGSKIQKSKSEKANVEISLAKTNVDLTLSGAIKPGKLQAEFHAGAKDVGGPEASLKITQIEKTSIEIALPKVELKSDIDADVSKPELDFAAEDIAMNVKAPAIDVDLDSADHKMKGQDSKFKMPLFGVSLPKLTGPKFGISGPDIKAQKMSIDANVPKLDFSLPKADADVELSDVKPGELEAEIRAITIDVEGLDASIKIPEITMSSKDRAASNVEGKFDIDAGLSKPVVAPDLSMDIKAPDAGLNAPTIDVVLDTADLKVKGQDSKFKMPSMKMPRFGVSLPKFKGTDVDVGLKKTDVDISLTMPDVEVKGKIPAAGAPECEVDIDIEGKGGKMKLPKFKGSQFGISGPDIKPPKMSIDVNLPKLDISLPKADAEAKFPEGEIKPGKLEVECSAGTFDVEGPDASIKIPEITMPSIDRAAPNVEGKFDIDAGLSKPEFDVAAPDFSMDIKAPDTGFRPPTIDVVPDSTDLKMKGQDSMFKIPSKKMPSLAVSLPKFKGPDVNVGLEKTDVDISLTKPDMVVKGKMPDVGAPECEIAIDTLDVDMKGKGGKMKLPKFKGPTFGISGPDIKAPKMSIDANVPKVDISSPKVDANVKLPDVKPGEIEVEIQAGTIDVEGPQASIKIPEITMPSIDRALPNVEGKFDINAALSKPEFDVEAPDLSMDVNAPAIDIHAPTIDVDLDSTDLKVKDHDRKFKLPSIKMPSMKMPRFGVSLPKFKGTDVDVGLKKTDVDISHTMPDVEIKGKIPDAGAPECEADIDIEGKGGKMKLPKFKGSQFGISGPDIKPPKMSIDVNLPKLDISLPKADAEVKFPEGEIKPGKLEVECSAGTLDVKGPDASIKIPEITMPSIDRAAPNVEGKFDIDAGLSKPEFDVAAPDFSMDIKAPDTGFRPPTIDVVPDSTDLKMKGQDSMFKIPSKKMPSLAVSLPKFKGPDVDVGLEKTDVDISLTKPDVDVKGKMPNVGALKCEVAIDTSDVDIKGKGSKIKLPKFKGPKFGISGPDIKAPKMSIDANVPKVDISSPKVDANVKLPDVKPGEIEVEIQAGTIDVEGPQASIKIPEITMPSIDRALPNVDGKFDINAALSKPEFDVAAPDLSMDVNAPAIDIHAPTIDADLDSTDLKVKDHDRKFKMPSMKMPSMNMPSFAVTLPKFKGPDVDVGLEKTDVDISLTKPDMVVKGKMPDVGAPECEIAIDTLDVDMKGKGGKMKLPKFKGPKFGISGPDIKAPKMSIDANVPKVDISSPKVDANVKLPDVKPGEIEVEIQAGTIDVEGPQASIKIPEITMPSIDRALPNVEGKFDINAALSKPEFDVEAPDLSMDVNAPAIDIHAPTIDVDFDSTDLKVKDHDRKFKLPSIKMPSMKMPRFGVSLPKFKGTDVDVGLKKTDVDISHTMPDVEVKGKIPAAGAPECEVDIDIEGKGGKMKLPKFKGSQFGISGPDIKPPKMSIDVNLPKLAISLPKADAEAKFPEGEIKPGKLEVECSAGTFDVEGPDASIKIPEITMPSIDRAAPNVEGKFDIDASLSKPEFDVAAPDFSMDIKAPDTGFRPPTIDVVPDSTDLKMKGRDSMFKMQSKKMPSLAVSLPKFKGPDVDVGLEKTDVDISLTKPDVEVKGKMPNVGALKCEVAIDTSAVDIKGKGSKIKLPKFKGPKFGISGPDIKAPKMSIDVNLPKLDISSPKVDANVKLPDVKPGEIEVEIQAGTIDVEGPQASIKIPEITMPSIDRALPNVEGKFDINAALSKPEFDVAAPDLSMDVYAPAIDIHAPTIDADLDSTDLKVKDHDRKFKMPSMKIPSMKMPRFGVSVPKFKGTDVDVGLKKTDVDVSLTMPDVEAKGKFPDVGDPECEVDIDTSDVDMKGKGGKMKLPKFKGSQFGISGPDIKAPKMSIDVNLPKLDISLPKADAEVKFPEGEIKPGKFEVEFLAGTVDVEGPEASIKIPEITKPSMDSTVPKVEGKFDVDKVVLRPELAVAAHDLSMDINAPAIDIHAPTIDVDFDSTDLKVKDHDRKFKMPSMTMPSMKMPRFGVSLPKFKGTDVDVGLKKTDVDISHTMPDVEVTGKIPAAGAPECEVDIDIEGKGGKMKLPKFKGSQFGISGPDIKPPKMSIDVNLPKLDISLPKADAEAKFPEGEIKPGKLEVECSAGTFDVEGPDASIKIPEITMPSIDRAAPNVEGKFDIDASLSKPEFDVAAPDFSMDIKAPDTGFRPPTIDVVPDSTDLKMKGRDSMFKMQSKKMPSLAVSLPKFKGPDVDVGLEKTDVDISLTKPDVEVKGKMPNVGALKCEVAIDTSDVDMKGKGGKMKLPKFKGSQFGISGPDIKAPKMSIDVNLPKLDISLPKADAEVKFPEGEIKPGKFEVEFLAGTVDVEGPEASIKIPEITKPSMDSTVPKVEGKFDVDKVVLRPELAVAAHDLSMDINAPAIDIHAPTIDVDFDSTDLKVKDHDRKFKMPSMTMPSMKMPRFGVSLPKFKGTDVDVGLKKTDVDISHTMPDVEVTGKIPAAGAPECEVDIDIEGKGGKMKLPKFKVSQFGISGPDIKPPKMSIDVNLPKLDISLPKADAEVKFPEGEIKPGKLEVECSAGTLDVKGPDASIKIPEITMPSIDRAAPNVEGKFDIDAGLSKPEFDVAAPDFSMDIKAPDTGFRPPTIDVVPDSTDLKMKGQDSMFKIPSKKMPSLAVSLPKFKGPDVDVGLEKTDVDISLTKPDVEVKGKMPNVGALKCEVAIDTSDVDIKGKGSKIKLPKFKGPKFGISGPDIKAPKMSIDANVPKVNISSPKVDANVKLPDVKPGEIEIEIQAGTIDVEGPQASIKIPEITMPSIDRALPNVEGKFDINAALSKPEFDVAAPDLSMDVNAPAIDIHAPTIDVDLDSTDLKVKDHDRKFKMPSIKMPSMKMPRFGVSVPKFKGPDVDVGLKKTDVDVSLTMPDVEVKGKFPDVGDPECEVDIDTSDVDMKGKGGKMKLPKFKGSQFGISGPDIKAPKMSIDVNLPKLDISLPKADAEVKLPEGEIKPGKFEVEFLAGTVDVEGPEASIKIPEITKPSMDSTVPKVEGKFDVDKGVLNPELAVAAHDLSMDVNAPAIDIHAPTIDVDFDSTDLKVKDHDRKFKMPSMKVPSMKMPRFGVSVPKFKGPDVDVGLKKTDVDISHTMPDVEVKGKIHDAGAPECEVDIDIEGKGGKMKLPKFKGSQFGISGPDIKPPKMSIDVNLPKLDISLPKADAEVKFPEGEIKPGKLEVECSAGTLNVEGPDASIKIPEITMPSIDRAAPNVEGKFDIDAGLSKPEFDVAAPDFSMDIKTPDTGFRPPTIDVVPDSTDLKMKGQDSMFKMPSKKMPSLAVSLPKFKGPDVDVGLEKTDVDISLTKPDIEVKGKMPNVGALKCEVAIDTSDVDIKGKGSKIKLPKFKGPKFGISGPDIKAPKMSIDANVPKLDISSPKVDANVKLPDVKPGEIEVEIQAGTIDVEGPQACIKIPEITVPSIDRALPNVEGKFDINAALSKPEFDVAAPDLSMDVNAPAIDIHAPKIDVDLDSTDLKVKDHDRKFKMPSIKMPSMKMPRFGVSVPKFKGPDVDVRLKKTDVDISLTMPDVEVKGKFPDAGAPECEVDIDVDGKGGKMKLSKFKEPKFGISGPDIKAPKMVIDVNLPQLDISLPKADAEVKLPEGEIKPGKFEVECSAGTLDVEGPDASIKIPKITMPSINRATPNKEGKFAIVAGLSKPEFDVAASDFAMDIKAPDTGFRAPTIDVVQDSTDLKMKGQGSMFKMPSMKMSTLAVSLPKFKGLDVDVGLEKTDVDISLTKPNMVVKAKMPDVGAPECEIAIDTLAVDMKGKGGKMKLPKFKGPKFGISGPDIKAPKMSIDVNLPKLDISLPKADAEVKFLEGEIKPGKFEVEFLAGTVDVEGPDASIKIPEITMPSIDRAAPNVEGKFDIDAGLSKHEFDVAAPDFTMDIKAPDTNFRPPTLDVVPDSTDLKMKGQDSMFKMPSVKMPSLPVSLPKFKGPDVGVGLQKTDVDISLTKPDVEVKGKMPNVGALKCEVAIDTSDVNMKGKGGKIKLPKFKGTKFGISGPNIKAPKMSIDVNVPKLDISLPKAEGPEASINIPEITKPSIDSTVPKVDGKFDVDKGVLNPELAVAAHDLSMDINAPAIDIHAPTIYVDLDSTDLKVKDHDRKFKMPSMKMPRFGVSVPKFKGPDVDVGLKKTDVDVSLTMPDVEVKGKIPDAGAPECEVDIDIDGKGGKMKRSKFKGPKFGISGPDIKAPKMSIDVNLPKLDISLPKADAEVKLSEGEIKPGKLEVECSAGTLDVERPDASIKIPKITMPSIDRAAPNVEGKFDIDAGLSKHEFDVAAPDFSMDIKAPDTGFHAPTIDVVPVSTDLKMKGQDSMFKMPSIKMPSIKMPSFGISLPKFKASHVDGELKMPDGEISLTNPDMEVKGKMADVGALECEVAIDTSDMDIKGKGEKMKLPKFTGPKFGITGPDIKAPKMSIDVNLPKLDIYLPKADAEVKLPEGEIKPGKLEVECCAGTLDVKGPAASIKIPEIAMPSIDHAVPNVEGKFDIDAGLSKPELDVAAQDLSMDVNAPAAGFHPPPMDVDLDSADLKMKGHDSKFKIPFMKIPRFGVSLHKFKGPDVDVGLEKTDVDISLTKPDVEVKGKMPNVGDPECEVAIDTSDVDMKGKGGKIKLPKFKGPKFGISGPDIKAPKMSIDVNLPKLDISLPKADAEVKLPEGEIKPGKFEVEFLAGTVDVEGPEASITIPEITKPSLDSTVPKVEGKFDVDKVVLKPELAVAAHDLSMDVNAPAIDIHAPTIDIDLDSTDLKVKDHDRKFKMPSMTMPSFGISLPKFKASHVGGELKLADGNISLTNPDMELKVKMPDVGAPECEVAIDTPDVDIKVKGGKMKVPKFEGAKHGISGPDIKAPKISIDANVPKVDISSPKADANVKLPDVKLGEIEVEIQAGTIDVEGPEASIKIPEITMPSIDRALPNVEGKFDINAALSKPEFDVAAPDFSMDIKAPDTGFRAPTIDVVLDSTDLKMKGQDSKFKMPSIKVPSIKMPSFGISLPKFKASHVDGELKMPDGEISLTNPDMEVKGKMADVGALECEVAIDTSDVDMKGKGGKIKLPKFKGPKFGISGPDIKAPKMSIDVNLPKLDISLPKADAEVKLPEGEIKPGKFEVEFLAGTVDVEGPEANIKIPEITKPSLDSTVPKVEGKFDVDKVVLKPELAVAAHDLSMDVNAPAIDIHAPTIDIDLDSTDLKVKHHDRKFKMPSMTMPSFGISLPKFKASHVGGELKLADGNISLTNPDMELKVKMPDVGAPECEVAIDTPDVDIKGKGGKMKVPKFEGAKHGISGPDIKAPKISIDANVPKVDISSPKADANVKLPDVKLGEIEVEIQAGTIDVEGPEASIKIPEITMPSIDRALPNVEGKFDINAALSKPEFDVAAPDFSMDIKAPDTGFRAPTIDVVLDSTDLKMKGQDSKFKMPSIKVPSIKMPSFGISLPKFKASHVDGELKMPDGEISLTNPDMEVKGKMADVGALECEVAIDTSDMDIKGKGEKMKLPKFTGPKFGISGPDIKAPKMSIDVNLPKLDISLPKADAEVKLPEGEIKPGKLEVECCAGILDVKGPAASIKIPEIAMPSIDHAAPNVEGKFDIDAGLSKPELGVAAQDLSMDVNAPAAGFHPPPIDVDLDSADLKMKSHDSKFKIPFMKIPRFGVSLHKFKGPDVDVGLEKTDVDISLTKPDVEVKGKMPNVGDPECEVAIDTSDVDMKGKGGKIKLPKFKGPKFGISGPDIKAPKMSIDVNLPKLDISLPKTDAEVKLPQGEIKPGKFEVEFLAGTVDVEGPEASIKIPEITKPSLDSTVPKVEGKFDVDKVVLKPELAVAAHDLSMHVNAPAIDIHAPTIDVDLDSTDLKVKDHDRKFKMPSMTMPSFGISLPKFKASHVGGELKLADGDISLTNPEMELKVKMPDVGAPECEVAIDTPDVDIKGKGGKMKVPKFEGANLKMTEFEKPSVDIAAPNMEGKFDFDTGLSKPELDVAAQDLSMDVNAPAAGFHPPTIDVDVDTADLKMKGHDSKFKIPFMKIPRFGISLHKFKGPDVDVGLKKTDVNVSHTMPDVEVKGKMPDEGAPECEVDIDTDGKGGKMKLPKFKGPKFGISGPDLKAPKMSIDVNLPKLDISLPKADAEVKLPEGEKKPGKFEVEFLAGTLDVEGPETSIKIPEITKPSMDSTVPKVEGKFDVDKVVLKPELAVAAHDLSMDVNAPAIDIHAPTIDVDLDSTDLKVKDHDRKFKMPSMTMPSFGISLPKFKASHVGGELKLADVDISLTMPDVEVKGKMPDKGAPECDIKGKEGKIKLAKFKRPDFGISAPDGSQASQMSLDVSLPQVDISHPKADMDLKLQEADLKRYRLEADFGARITHVDGRDACLEMPKIEKPSIDFALPKVVVELDVHAEQSKTEHDFAAPDLSMNVKAPPTGIHAPTIDVDVDSTDPKVKAHDSKFKMPFIKMPLFEISLPKFKGAEMGVGLEEPDLDILFTNPEGEVRGKIPDLGAPGFGVAIETSDMDNKTSPI